MLQPQDFVGELADISLAVMMNETIAWLILVPLSTWAVYFAELLEINDATESAGMWLYIQSIPFMLYGWVAMGLVLLVAIGIMPDIGPMKAAEARARNGQPIPDDAPDIALGEDDMPRTRPWVGVINFLAPMAVLIGASAWFEIDLLKGVIVAIMFTILLYLIQRLATFATLMDAIRTAFAP